MFGLDKDNFIQTLKNKLGDLFEDGKYIYPFQVRPIDSGKDYHFYLRDTNGINHNFTRNSIREPFRIVENYTLVVVYTDKISTENLIASLISILYAYSGVNIVSLSTDNHLIGNTELKLKAQRLFQRPMIRINFTVSGQGMISPNCETKICLL